MRPLDPRGDLSRRRFVVTASKTLVAVTVAGGIVAPVIPSEAGAGTAEGGDGTGTKMRRNTPHSLVPLLHAAGTL